MKHFKSFGIAAGLAVALMGSAHAADIKLMTGPQGGVWVPLGGQLKDMWEKAVPGLNVQSLAGRRHRQRARRRGRQGRVGFGNSISTVDAVAGRRAVQQEARQCLQHRDALPAIFPGRRAADARHQHGQGPQGQVARHAAARQHRRADHRAVPQGERPQLQRREDELRVVHRRRDADAGRPRRSLHARHHHSRPAR